MRMVHYNEMCEWVNIKWTACLGQHIRTYYGFYRIGCATRVYDTIGMRWNVYCNCKHITWNHSLFLATKDFNKLCAIIPKCIRYSSIVIMIPIKKKLYIIEPMRRMRTTTAIIIWNFCHWHECLIIFHVTQYGIFAIKPIGKPAFHFLFWKTFVVVTLLPSLFFNSLSIYFEWRVKRSMKKLWPKSRNPS